MYLEDQNIRNIQQLASRIHIYVVVLLFSSFWNSLNCPSIDVFFSGEQMKLNHVCPTLIVKLSCSAQPFWLVLCSILLMKLNSKRKNSPRVWNVHLFSPQQHKNSRWWWIDVFSYGKHPGWTFRAFKVYDP